jgi:hypothetical protein
MNMKKKNLFSNFVNFFQKIFLKISKLQPSPQLVAIFVMVFSIFLLGGGIYDITMNPIAIFPLSSGRFIFYYPFQLHDQLLNESIGVMLFYGIGALGLFLIYQSTKHIRNPRQVSAIVKIGVALFVISFIAIEAILYWKLNVEL